MWWWRRRQGRQNRNSPPLAPVSWDDILPHLRTTTFFTGAFCVAWTWDLMYYGSSHAAAGENPVVNQLSLGNPQAPKYLWRLVLEYLSVCGGAAILSSLASSPHRSWSAAAVTAIEFLPSPVFAGKLMAYLASVSRLGTLEQAVWNLVATWLAATLAHGVPLLVSSLEQQTAAAPQASQSQPDSGGSSSVLEQWRLQRFGGIVQSTLGFGLGIAWNVCLGTWFAPSSSSHPSSEWSLLHLIGLVGYLAVVTLLAFRLAALVPPNNNNNNNNNTTATIWDRQLVLLAFAAYVVNAFTLVALLGALLPTGWLGRVEALLILLVLSAGMTALVVRSDLEGHDDDQVDGNDEEDNKPGPLRLFVGGILLLVPCVWCICPWVPVLWLLSGTTATGAGVVKEQWYKLIAMVAGLASSIEASSMLTDLTDWMATPFCTAKHCPYPWLFVLLQMVVAIVVTLVLLPAISMLMEPGVGAAAAAATTANRPDEEQGERKPLLRRLRDSIRTGSSSS